VLAFRRVPVRPLSLESTPDEVDDEEKLGKADYESCHADENVDVADGALREKLVLVKGIVSSRNAHEAEIVHREEDGICADKSQPEVKFAQLLVHHPTEHFGKPVINGGVKGKQSRSPHDHVEVSDYEVSVMQLNVNGWVDPRKDLSDRLSQRLRRSL